MQSLKANEIPSGSATSILTSKENKLIYFFFRDII